MKSKFVKYSITICVGAAIAFIVWGINGLFNADTAVRVLAKLTDGFFVAGVLLAGIGGLLVSYNEGVIDGLAYGLHGLFGFRNIKKDSTPKKETYHDYKKRKHAKKISVKHFIIVGLAYIIVSIIIFIVYVNVR